MLSVPLGDGFPMSEAQAEELRAHRATLARDLAALRTFERSARATSPERLALWEREVGKLVAHIANCDAYLAEFDRAVAELRAATSGVAAV